MMKFLVGSCEQRPMLRDGTVLRSSAVTIGTMTVLREEHPGFNCQYKEDGLVSRPPSLFTSVRRPMHGTRLAGQSLYW